MQHVLSAGAAQRRSDISIQRLVVWLPIAFALILGAALALLLAYERAKTIGAAERLTESYAQITQEQTTRTIQGIEQTLRATEAAIAVAASTEASISAALQELLVDRPFLLYLRVLDAEGQVVFSTDGNVGINMSDRPYFAPLRQNPAARFELGIPFRETTPTGWILPATRTRQTAGGGFAGVIVAAVDPGYFDKIWTLNDQNADMTIGLFRADGAILIRAPPFLGSEAIGTIGNGQIFKSLRRSSPVGTYRAYSLIDNRDRLFSYSTLSAYPSFVIIVGVTVRGILAPWYEYVWIVGVGWFVGSASLVALAFWLRHEWRRRLENEERYRLLFDANPHPMWVFDGASLHFLAVNQAAIEHYGWSREEFLSMTLDQIRRPEDAAILHAALRESSLDTHGAVRRMRHQTRDGTLIDVEATARMINLAGQRAGVVLAQDITERTRAEQTRRTMEERMLQMQKMEAVGQMTGGIAHDFNNLLTVIMMKMEVLQEDLPPDSPFAPAVRATTAAAQRGADLVARLLAFSRRRELDAVTTDIAGLLASFRPLLAAAVPQVKLTIETAADLRPCIVDRTGLETAILNLAVNARDAMPDRGSLRITARNRTIGEDEAQQRADLVAGDWVEIAVIDAGSGIAPELLSKVFEPFFTTKAEGKGTGLGLSMVFGFITQSDGFITVDSVVGQGTTIALHLRAAPAQP